MIVTTDDARVKMIEEESWVLYEDKRGVRNSNASKIILLIRKNKCLLFIVTAL